MTPAQLRGPVLVPNVTLPAASVDADDTASLGAVTVRLLVDTRGRVRPGSVQILESPTPEVADAFAEAAAGWRFRPAEIGPGCTVEGDVRLRLRIRRSQDGEGFVVDPAPAAA